MNNFKTFNIFYKQKNHFFYYDKLILQYDLMLKQGISLDAKDCTIKHVSLKCDFFLKKKITFSLLKLIFWYKAFLGLKHNKELFFNLNSKFGLRWLHVFSQVSNVQVFRTLGLFISILVFKYRIKQIPLQFGYDQTGNFFWGLKNIGSFGYFINSLEFFGWSIPITLQLQVSSKQKVSLSYKLMYLTAFGLGA